MEIYIRCLKPWQLLLTFHREPPQLGKAVCMKRKSDSIFSTICVQSGSCRASSIHPFALSMTSILSWTDDLKVGSIAASLTRDCSEQNLFVLKETKGYLDAGS